MSVGYVTRQRVGVELSDHGQWDATLSPVGGIFVPEYPGPKEVTSGCFFPRVCRGELPSGLLPGRVTHKQLVYSLLFCLILLRTRYLAPFTSLVFLAERNPVRTPFLPLRT